MARFAKRVATAGAEPKRFEVTTQLGANVTQGDGTSRVVQIMNLPSNLVQGTTEGTFTGNTVWLKGVSVRFNLSIPSTPGFTALAIRWFLIKSRANAINMLGSGATYGNTTTDQTNPTQGPNAQFTNPRIFDVAGSVASFVGESYATQFDRTNTRVIKTKTYRINAGGAGQAPSLHKFFFRIGRTHQYSNPDALPLTVAPNHGKYGSYYLCYQIFGQTGTANISSTVVGTMDYKVELYFRDP